ncbi:MAG: Antitoxin Phd YefM, type toxin-antitoxin system [Verrucomicrobiota bacterium]|jgi:antitoxin (DNA-binding transcriptional repressor) of toxin-antitoxin stability system
MKTMTIRDIRHRWPEAEKALATESEILITRDGCPVARLLPSVEESRPKKCFDPEEQRLWMEEFWGKDVFFDSLTGLQEDREDRQLP